MPGTGPRQRAVIALSFGVQAVLIAGALTLPAEVSSMGVSASGSSVAVPEPVTLLPVVSPLINDRVPPGSVFPVTVKIGAASSTWTTLTAPSVFLIKPGPGMTATVTLTLPDGYYVHSLSFSATAEGPLQAMAATTRNLLSVPGPLSPGAHTFTLHLGNLAPQSGGDLTMTVTRPGSPGVASDLIAEIVTS